jgi:hypothetical protein
VIASYAAGPRLRDVTVVADAGMLSERNLEAIALTWVRFSTGGVSRGCGLGCCCGVVGFGACLRH